MSSWQKGSLIPVTVALVLAIGLAAGHAHAARMVPLSDAELDAIYAEGLVIDLKVDLAISDGATVVSNVGWEQVQDLVANGFQIQKAGSDGPAILAGSLLGPGGAFAVLNPAEAGAPFATSSGPLDFSGSGINLDVINGDVAIGINLAVFVNSVISDSSLYQLNINFGDIGDVLGILTQ
jgi:molybdopterin-binding protein